MRAAPTPRAHWIVDESKRSAGQAGGRTDSRPVGQTAGETGGRPWQEGPSASWHSVRRSIVSERSGDCAVGRSNSSDVQAIGGQLRGWLNGQRTVGRCIEDGSVVWPVAISVAGRPWRQSVPSKAGRRFRSFSSLALAQRASFLRCSFASPHLGQSACVVHDAAPSRRRARLRPPPPGIGSGGRSPRPLGGRAMQRGVGSPMRRCERRSRGRCARGESRGVTPRCLGRDGQTLTGLRRLRLLHICSRIRADQ